MNAHRLLRQLDIGLAVNRYGVEQFDCDCKLTFALHVDHNVLSVRLADLQSKDNKVG